jgi:hypothetical protein
MITGAIPPSRAGNERAQFNKKHHSAEAQDYGLWIPATQIETKTP